MATETDIKGPTNRSESFDQTVQQVENDIGCIVSRSKRSVLGRTTTTGTAFDHETNGANIPSRLYGPPGHGSNDQATTAACLLAQDAPRNKGLHS